MKLTLATVASLPLAAAAVDADNSLLARTPEWCGVGIGTVTYGLGTTSLLVTPVDQSAQVSVLVDELLLAMRRAVSATGDEFADRLAVTASALGVVFGRRPKDVGTVGHVVHYLQALSKFHPGTDLLLRPGTVGPTAEVRSPGAVAMALHQLIRNASGHDDTSAVHLLVGSHGRGSLFFSLDWASNRPAPPRPIRTSRALSRRVSMADDGGVREHRGWGLGYVTVAADALGAVRTGPLVGPDGVRHVTWEFGVPRLMLPVACFQNWRVTDTTPGWEAEEVNCPRRGEPLGLELEGIIRDARAAAGHIVSREAWLARHVPATEKTYVALPPDGMVERARDIIVGCSHEQESWQVREPIGTILNALLVLVALAAGQPEDEWLVVPWGSEGTPGWSDTFTIAATALGLGEAAPLVQGPSLDARAVAYLFWRYGESWGRRGAEGVPDGLLTLRIRPEFASDPVMSVLGAKNGELLIEWSPQMLARGARA